MKNLRITKMVSVFSKRSMLACMIAGGILSLNSCDNKDELATQPQVTPEVVVAKGVTLKENRLTFETIDAFKQYRKSIDKKSSIQLMEVDKQIGLVSHLTDIASTMSSTTKGARISEEVYQKVEKRVRDPYFASILNKNREVQIGNTIYRCNADYTFEYQKGEEKSIDEFYNQQKSSKISFPNHQAIDFKDLKVAKTDVVIQKITSKVNSPNARVAYDCTINYSQDGSYRMGGEYFREWYFFFTTAGVSTQMEHERGWWIFKGWYDEDADYVSVEALRVALYYNGPTGNYDINFTNEFRENYNDDVATCIFDWFVGIPFVGGYVWQGGAVTSKCTFRGEQMQCQFWIQP
jgi:hypothetical protein